MRYARRVRLDNTVHSTASVTNTYGWTECERPYKHPQSEMNIELQIGEWAEEEQVTCVLCIAV